jgi:uncharacterized protein YlaI
VTVDPLGLERCVLCHNAFVYDADDEATQRLNELADIGFICRYCAEEVASEGEEQPQRNKEQRER